MNAENAPQAIFENNLFQNRILCLKYRIVLISENKQWVGEKKSSLIKFNQLEFVFLQEKGQDRILVSWRAS